MKIHHIHARQILDSRGYPTVEAEVTLEDGIVGRAAVPSGVSAGHYEAVELRDGDPTRYAGMSVYTAVENVNTTIAKAVQGQSMTDQRKLDQLLLDVDGTRNKKKLGANAILSVSLAACRARALAEGIPLWQSLAQQFDVIEPPLLPTPLIVLIEGGKHSDSGLAFQEFIIVPSGFDTFSDALRAGAETFYALKEVLQAKGHVIAVGDEGAYAANLTSAEHAFDFLTQAIEAAGYTGRINLALDAAASEFFKDGKYQMEGKSLTAEQLTEYYEKLCEKYPVVSIEDSHIEEDWDSFQRMKQRLGQKVQLVGDDLLVTNTARILTAVEKDAVNAVLIKVNQIGTVSETVDAIELTKKQGWKAIVSHRGGDTEDTFIAHLVVGLATGQIKTGSLSRGERTAKYNELLRIEEALGATAQYAGQ